MITLARRARTGPQTVKPARPALYRLVWTYRGRVVVSEPSTLDAALAMFDAELSRLPGRVGRLRVISDADYLAGGGGDRG